MALSLVSPVRSDLPREVLQWILNLQLSFYPRNVRRDFSNGYLVADIFSRYYPKVFLLYSYKNGAALSIKQDNWRHIQKFLQKLNINLSQDLINGTMHLEKGAAERLLTEIYGILTQQNPDVGSSLNAAESDLSSDTERREELLSYKPKERTHSTEQFSSPFPASVPFKEIKVHQPIRRHIQQ
ncbi:hypothetical protein NL108_000598 [Boleophthalmus pectinirostris]|uniref:spermatogenesis-associated protein 4 n=1 Tax=Boleophthalmus pectinirostris TaxID=150288 RepID=UPI00242F795C|nr:spermatogenesis-associated protein 4 [Boleophthalmus pectinirostris]KAJ0049739.1 hypothetical protein NL108_000598 [Boleophthalmus pectinirostris]